MRQRAVFCAHIHIAVIRTEASVDANLLTSIASCMPKDESLLLFLWWFALRDGVLFLGLMTPLSSCSLVEMSSDEA